MSELCRYVDVCISNEEDAKDVFGIEAAETDITGGKLNKEGYKSVARQLADQFGFERVAITLRSSISASDNDWAGMLYDGEHYCFSKEYHLRIVDRVGGGDSFGGGLIYALLAGKDSQAAIEFAVAPSSTQLREILTALPWRRSKSWPVETAPAGYSADTGHGERRRNGTAHKIAEKYRWVDAQHRTAERFRPAQRLKRHCIS